MPPSAASCGRTPAGTRPPDTKEGVAMNDKKIPDSRGAYSPWLQMMSNVVWGQWRLLDAQYQASLDLLKTLARPKETEAGPAPQATASIASGGLSDLEGRALERVRKGF